MKQTGDKFLRIPEAARFLGIKERTLREWVAPRNKNREKLPIRRHGKCVVFWTEELKTWSDKKNAVMLGTLAA